MRLRLVSFVMRFCGCGLGLGVWLWLLGWAVFDHMVEGVPTSLPVLISHNASAVVFTGSPGRLAQGLELIRQGKVKSLLLSGVGADRQVLLSPDLRAFAISVGMHAKDTLGNAREAAQWVSERRLLELILITSDYHMPRSFYVLHRVMPRLKIIVYAVKTSGPKRMLLAFQEYHKFLWTLAPFGKKSVYA